MYNGVQKYSKEVETVNVSANAQNGVLKLLICWSDDWWAIYANANGKIKGTD